MSKFRQGKPAAEEGAEPTKPQRTIVLSPNAFADSWRAKPKTDVCIGLRLISSADVVGAEGQAEEQAMKWYPRKDWPDLSPQAVAVALDTANGAYNTAVMRHCVARGTCDPNDITKPYFKNAEDTVRDALTEPGVQRIWDELLILKAMTSVAITRASPEDVERIGRILADGRAMEALGPGDHLEVRMLLGYVHAILHATGQAHEKDLDGGHEGYVVRSARRVA